MRDGLDQVRAKGGYELLILTRRTASYHPPDVLRLTRRLDRASAPLSRRLDRISIVRLRPGPNRRNARPAAFC